MPAPSVRGLLQFTAECPQCIIISSGWPSWLYLCGTLHIQCLAVFTDYWDHLWVAHARESGPLPQTLWFPLIDLTKSASQFLSQPCTILVQGQAHLPLPSPWFTKHSILWAHPHSPLPELPYSCTISHLETGGVLDASWTFFSNTPFRRQLPTLPSSSLLQKIGWTTHCTRRQICSPPERSHHRSLPFAQKLPGNIVDCRGLLPLDPPSIGVLCPSVFAKMGWVVRPLSDAELYQVFDLPPSAIPKHVSDAANSEDKPLWQLAPPSKVLQRAYLQWAQEIGVNYQAPPTPGRGKPSALTMYNATEALVLDSAFVSAIKADGADTPVFLWNDRIWALGMHNETRVARFRVRWDGHCPLDGIRAGLLCYWRGRVRRSLLKYLKETYGPKWWEHPGSKQDAEIGRDCLTRTSAADWWEWGGGGSTLFFWRWPPYLKSLVTEGHPSWLLSDLPTYRRPQRYEPDGDTHAKVKSKLENVLSKRYIAHGTVTSLTSYFAIPKGMDDIRLVYDASRSGLNKVLWVPSFPLP
jgi:hypothetical protein